MGRYIDWSDIVDRYPEIETLGGAAEIGETHINYAEAFIDGMLSDRFTPPFSNNNMTIKDLSIDAVYWRAGRFKFEDAASIYSMTIQTISMLRKGELNMVDSGGNVLEVGEKTMGIYSSTESYHSAFGIDDPINWRIDSDYMSDVQDSRL